MTTDRPSDYFPPAIRRTPRPPAPPPIAVPWRNGRPEIPMVDAGANFRVPYGCKDHVEAVRRHEEATRASRTAAIAQSKADVTAIEAEQKRLRGLRDEAKAAAFGVDPEMRVGDAHVIRLRWVQLELSVASVAAEVAAAHQRVDEAKERAQLPLVTAADVARMRDEWLAEQGLNAEAIRNYYNPDYWETPSPTAMPRTRVVL